MAKPTATTDEAREVEIFTAIYKHILIDPSFLEQLIQVLGQTDEQALRNLQEIAGY